MDVHLDARAGKTKPWMMQGGGSLTSEWNRNGGLYSQAAAQFVDVEALVEQQLGRMAPASGQAQVVRQIASISNMRLEKKKFPKNFEGVLRFNNTVRPSHLLRFVRAVLQQDEVFQQGKVGNRLMEVAHVSNPSVCTNQSLPNPCLPGQIKFGFCQLGLGLLGCRRVLHGGFPGQRFEHLMSDSS
jgi:hypothetical protein